MGAGMTNSFINVTSFHFQLLSLITPTILVSLQINPVNVVFLCNTEVECFTVGKIRIFKYCLPHPFVLKLQLGYLVPGVSVFLTSGQRRSEWKLLQKRSHYD
jgi:hypothetical protein